MVRPIKPTKPIEHPRAPEPTKKNAKSSNKFKEIAKVVEKYVKEGKRLGAGKPPFFTDHAPKGASEKVSRMAAKTPSLHPKKSR